MKNILKYSHKNWAVFVGTMTLYLTSGITNMSHAQKVSVRWSKIAQDSFLHNEDVFLPVTIKNQSDQVVNFRIICGLFSGSGQFMGHFLGNNRFNTDDFSHAPWNPESCENGGGMKLQPSDSLIYVVPLAGACLGEACLTGMQNNWPYSDPPFRYLDVGSSYHAKVMVMFSGGEYFLLEKDVKVIERDQKVFDIVNAYYKKRKKDIAESRKSKIYYSTYDTTSKMLDTLSYMLAYDVMMGSFLVNYPIEDLKSAEFFKKYKLRVRDKNLLIISLQDMVQGLSEYNNTFNSDRLAFYKDIMASLLHRDKRLASNFYNYLYAYSSNKEHLRKCPGGKYIKNVLTLEQLSELKKAFKK